MNKRKLTTIIMAALLAFDAYYLKVAFTAKKSAFVVVGPFEFSKILGIAMAILCVVILIENFTDEATTKEIKIEGLGTMALTMIASAALIIIWHLTKNLYIPGAVFMMFLFTLYTEKEQRFTKKKLIVNAVLSVVTMVFIFVSFEILVGIRL